MEIFIFIGILLAAIATAVIIIILTIKKFLRFDSVSVFKNLDKYLVKVYEQVLYDDMLEQFEAEYNYNNNIIYLNAVIFKTNRDAARCYNRQLTWGKEAKFFAKGFVIGGGKIKKFRLYKNTYLFVEGKNNSDFNDFYHLILSCLSPSKTK